MDIEEKVYEECLKNAVEHEGDASVDAVMKRVMSTSDADPNDTINIVKSTTSDVNEMDISEQKAELRDIELAFFKSVEDGEEDTARLPGLPNAESGDVRLRAAPNPNGFWHLGHARMPAVLGTYAERYNGEMIVRFDDTDPSNKRTMVEAYDQIIEDVEYLGFEPSDVYIASDRMELYYDYARKLINKDRSYICTCSPEKIRQDRRNGERCECYGQYDIDTFNSMVDGEIQSGDATVRIATDINHKNPAIRDWVGFRILDENHPRDLGDQYSLWPTLDFQSAIDDYELDITHIIRGIDLQDSKERQVYIYDVFDWQYPEVLHWGRINVDEYDIPLSSTSINELIEDGDLDGWDDIRAPTIDSLRSRGIRGESITEAMLELGLSTNNATLSMSSIYDRNRSAADSKTPRVFFVQNGEYTKFRVRGGPYSGDPPMYPDGTESRSIKIGDSVFLPDEAIVPDGERVWLKGIGCYKHRVNSLVYQSSDESLVTDGDVPVGYWVPSESAVECEIQMPSGGLISGYADPTISNSTKGDLFRFNLLGFVAKCDERGDEVIFRYAHD